MNILKFALIFIVGTTFAQQNSDEYIKYKKIYPDSYLVKLKQEIDINITLDKEGEINIAQKNSEENLYLNDAANYSSKESLSFSSFVNIDDIKASSFNFENGKYKEFKVSDFKENDNLDNSFHDDVKLINFIYPNIKKGSKSKLNYTETIKNPRFLSSFYFGEFFPIVNNQITITADKDIDLIFKKFNLEGVDVVFEKKVNRKTIKYKWTLKNSQKYFYEKQAPSYKNILPHIIPIIASYNYNGEKIKVLNDVSDLYKWYSSLVENVNSKPAKQELVALVNELTKDKESDLEKVKAIYYWTQKNIKYVAFEYALGGFIPREANDVFVKKYGDCKDNSSILYEMLKIAKIKGSLTWVGTRSIPYKYQEVPTPAVDNHMVLSYEDNDKTYYLDATGRYQPIEFPTSFIQGKEALVQGENGKFKIKTIPVVKPENNAMIDTTFLNIKNGVITGEAKVNLSGYAKVDLFNHLEYVKKEHKKKSFYNTMFQKGNNKFLIDEINETNKYSYDKDFIIDYKFTIKDYAKQLGDELYVNLNLYKTLAQYKIEESRKNGVEYDFKRYGQFNFILNIPEGYEVTYLPENSSISSELLTAHITYKKEKSKIIYQHAVRLNYLNLDKEQQKEINELISKMDASYKEIIILKKI